MPRKLSSNTAENNGKQRGGITGRGFMPGTSGNAGGRPRTSGLLNALRHKVTAQREDGTTIEEALADALITEALHGKHRLAAISEIFDRLEGRAKASLDVTNKTDHSDKSDLDLICFAAVGRTTEDLIASGIDPQKVVERYRQLEQEFGSQRTAILLAPERDTRNTEELNGRD